LSEEEDASDSRSTPQTDMQLASTVDRFYARKFSMKAGSGADKRAVLKVSNTETVKKQKTLNKSCMQGVLQVVGQEGLEKLINQAQTELGEPSEVVMTEGGSSPKVEPKHLTCTQDEAR
jgi:hypothetical protein